MSSVARVIGLIALAALLFIGAAGFTGYLTNEDFCENGMEGGASRVATSWTPPGMQCLHRDVAEVGPWQQLERTGSWPAFGLALALGFGVVGLALYRRPRVTPWLRLTTVTTLSFAVGGLGAYEWLWQGSVVAGVVFGLPVAFAADCWLRPGPLAALRVTAGFIGATVAFAALIVAAFGYLFGFGAAAYGVTILLVALATALPWWRLSPAPDPV